MKSLSSFVFFLMIVLCGEIHCFGITRYSDDPDYRITKIPPSLMKEADAVIRILNKRFEVKDQENAVEIVTFASTIFNKDERDYGQLILGYDKFSEIEELNGRIIDAEGNEVRELEKADVKDYSSFSDFSLYEDNRVKLAELYYDKYPYTVEFTYEISYKGFLNWPVWYSQTSLDAVEHSKFEVVIPKGKQLRYWTNQDSLKPVISSEGSKTVYVWEARNLPKLSKDGISDDIEDIAAIVRIAPDNFEIEGYKGSMHSWKDFGAWYYELCKGKDQLPESAIKDIHTLIKPEDNVYDKIKKLYNYMQTRTRYVSIQLGIGSWMPFDSRYVHEKGYGDCKALSNYMVSILKEAGIKAYRTLIFRGSDRLPIIKEFPSNQFNHAIVVIPLEKDTMWLECTSRIAPMGQIGWDNENRYALVVTEDGGVLIPTPKSRAEDNVQIRSAMVSLNSTGSLESEVKVLWKGNQQNDVRNTIDDATPVEREKWIVSTLGVPDVRINGFNFGDIENESPEGSLSLNVDLPNYASASGNRIFFQPNLMEKRTYVPKDVSHRLSPVRFNYPYKNTDSVYYIIPNGYTIEAIPAEVKLKSSFASFNSKTYSLGDTVIIFSRNLEVNDYSIPAKKYSEYRKFFSDVVKADRAQVVLVRKKQ